jgi:hypothetical protein
MHAWLWLLALLALAACGPEGAPNARQTIRETHAREVKELIAGDVARHLTGVAKAADKIVPGFLVVDAATRDTQMRTALRLLSKPPRGVPELIASARTFVAAIAVGGVVIATDAKKEVDRMTGLDLAKQFALVRDALEGKTGYAIDQFPAIEAGGEGSVSLLFAAPSRKDDKIVGAVLVGIPLWRLSQRLGKQLQLDHVSETGTILWVYVYRADKLHHFGTPPDLDTMMPNAAARATGLARSKGGFTGEFLQFGRWYGYGVLPLRVLGDGMGVVIVRADPPP